MEPLYVPNQKAPPVNVLLNCPYCGTTKSTQIDLEQDERNPYRSIEETMWVQKENERIPADDARMGTRRCPKCRHHFCIIYSRKTNLVRAYRKDALPASAILYT